MKQNLRIKIFFGISRKGKYNNLPKRLIKKAVLKIIEQYVYAKSVFSFKGSNSWQKVVIFCQCNLGDSLFTTPAIRALRQANPNAVIDIVVAEYNAEIFRDNPNLNEIIIWDRKLNSKGDIRYLIHKAKEIKAGNYDVAIFLELSPHNYNFQSLVSALAGIRDRIGVDSIGLSKYINLIVPISEEDYWPVVYGDVVQRIGASINNTAMDLFPSKRDQREVDELFRNLEINPQRETIIAVHTGAMNYGLRKNWGDKKFKELIIKLENECGPLTFLLTGSRQEKESISKITDIDGLRLFNIAGKLSFVAHAPLLKACKLLVTNDTSMLHLGIISRIPIVAIFGPTGPNKIIPEDYDNIKIVRKNLPCSPCYKRIRKGSSWGDCTNPEKEKCLNDISLNDVVSDCSHFISKLAGN